MNLYQDKQRNSSTCIYLCNQGRVLKGTQMHLTLSLGSQQAYALGISALEL